eukprot:10385408-Alexandrium_andersonii.AAC.1
MSASLVGSEMCIRDRSSILPSVWQTGQSLQTTRTASTGRAIWEGGRLMLCGPFGILRTGSICLLCMLRPAR